MRAVSREILRIAVPSIVTNITVPLLGMVDVAIVGHIGNASHISAIALGTMVFNLIYWNFGFLRAGTSGLTAQAYGARDRREYTDILVQGMSVALAAALLIICLRHPVAILCRRLIRSTPEVLSLMLSYFYIRVWAAPATISLYVIKGWFIGMQNARAPMWVATILNIVNILISLLLVYGFGAGIEGVAWGTVAAQYSGLLLAIAIWLVKYRRLLNDMDLKSALRRDRLVRFFKVNTDIFLRSLCLVAVFTFIPYISATMGEEILAANTLLMQLFTLTSYIMDGFAYAGESIVGKHVGARDLGGLKSVVRGLNLWGVALAGVFTLVFLLGGEWILRLLTEDPTVTETAKEYLFWSYLVPFAGYAAFIYDGIYIGATASVAMRNIMFVATAVFFCLYFPLAPFFANNALWLAFIVFLVTRGLLMVAARKRNVFGLIEAGDSFVSGE